MCNVLGLCNVPDMIVPLPKKSLSARTMWQTSKLYPDFMVKSIFPPVLLFEDIFKGVSPTTNAANFPWRLRYEWWSGRSQCEQRRRWGPYWPICGIFFWNTPLMVWKSGGTSSRLKSHCIEPGGKWGRKWRCWWMVEHMQGIEWSSASIPQIVVTFKVTEIGTEWIFAGALEILVNHQEQRKYGKAMG